jgi:hypothetical protein
MKAIFMGALFGLLVGYGYGIDPALAAGAEPEPWPAAWVDSNR